MRNTRPNRHKSGYALVRVLLVHQSFVDHQHPGGTRHLELASSLVKKGHEVTIVAGNLSYLTGKQFVPTRRLIAEQSIEGIRVLRAYVYPSLHRSFAWRLVSFLTFMVTSLYAGLRAGPVDVVWGTSPPIFQLFSTWLIAALRRRPLLLEIRDLWPEFAIGMGILNNRLLIWIARKAERFFYNRARHIIVNSPAYRDYLMDKGIRAEKITVIPNGVDPTMFDPSSTGEKFRQRWDLDQRFVVTYAGALGQANDIMTILKAAERLRDDPDIHFVFVGDGKDRRNLETYARSNRLSNVTFAGTYPKGEIKDVLAASSACIATLQDIPMFRTTYPNKVFDYMAAGRPTILAIDGVIREVIEESGGGLFVPPGEEAALADAAVQLRDNRDRSRAMGVAARRYVTEKFDRGFHATRLVELLEQIVHRGT